MAGIMLLLIISIASLAAGPLLHLWLNERPGAKAILNSAVILSVGGLVVLHILPHAWESSGWSIVIPLVMGLLAPSIVEGWMAQQRHQGTHQIIYWLIGSGLVLHALVDGIGLALPTHSSHPHNDQHALPLAIVLHRIPTGLVLWKLFPSPSLRHPNTATLAIFSTVIFATIGGYTVSHLLTENLPVDVLAYFQALVAGSLLHVVVHCWHPEHQCNDHIYH